MFQCSKVRNHGITVCIFKKKTNETTVPYPIFFLLLNEVQSQAVESDNYITWSSARKLSVSDFAIKTKNLHTSASSAQFSM
jgi:hypothetical protein